MSKPTGILARLANGKHDSRAHPCRLSNRSSARAPHLAFHDLGYLDSTILYHGSRIPYTSTWFASLPTSALPIVGQDTPIWLYHNESCYFDLAARGVVLQPLTDKGRDLLYNISIENAHHDKSLKRDPLSRAAINIA